MDVRPLLAGAATLCFMGSTYAQVSTADVYQARLAGAQLRASTESLDGARVNLQDGRTSFAVTDISIELNSKLPMTFGRKGPTFSQQYATSAGFEIMGQGWEPDVPYLVSRYDARDGWNAKGSVNRCSGASLAPRERTGSYPYYYQQLVYAHMYWPGILVNIPGSAQEKLLSIAQGQPTPQDGRRYVATTLSRAMISCLPSIKNGAGEGFALTTPQGLTYHFDWMATRRTKDLTTDGMVDREGRGYNRDQILAQLTDVYLFATSVSDRFGNTLYYDYDQTRPNRITSIRSGEGPRIDIHYDDAANRIRAASAGSKTWTYTYESRNDVYGVPSLDLKSLTYPDGSVLAYQGRMPGPEESGSDGRFWSDGCGSNPGTATSDHPPSGGLEFTVVQPSGARTAYKFRGIYHGTNRTPGGCALFGGMNAENGRIGSVGSIGTYGVPKASQVSSLYEKVVTGPGLPASVTTYYYKPSWSFESECSQRTCASFSETVVTEPSGRKVTYRYGNDFQTNMGRLLRIDTAGPSGERERVDIQYVSSAAGFADRYGNYIRGSWGNETYSLYGNDRDLEVRPELTRTTYRDGRAFVTTVSAYDQFARPISITRSSYSAQLPPP